MFVGIVASYMLAFTYSTADRMVMDGGQLLKCSTNVAVYVRIAQRVRDADAIQWPVDSAVGGRVHQRCSQTHHSRD